MPCKQTKILGDRQIRSLLTFASGSRNPDRDRLIVLLSVKAGLCIDEIADLMMVLGPTDGNRVGDRVARRRSATSMATATLSASSCR
jgi:hypothetical protein